MNNNKLLVCICFHYSESRVPILMETLKFLSEYDMDVHIVIDTNTSEWIPPNMSNIEVRVHTGMQHPYNLTFMHRQYIANKIDQYDWFMYIEDDMGVPYSNFKEFTTNFYSLWPTYVPSFVRIETCNGKDYIVDVLHPKSLNNIIHVDDKQFFDLSEGRAHINHAYHAFWIMPHKELKETMHNIPQGFFRISTDREWAASFTTWELGKIPLVRIENGAISKKSYSYHLSNNYCGDYTTPVAKIEIDKLFSI